jgi:hypothetical protein
MNESEIENELRALRPAPPSPELIERVTQELRTCELGVVPVLEKTVVIHRGAGVLDRGRSSSFGWWRGPAWAAAGAFAMWLLLPRATPPPTDQVTTPPASASEFQPGESSTELLIAADDGLLYDEDETPRRQFRLSSIERHTWTNPATGAVLQFEIPREDIVLMPVAMQ